MSGSPSLWRGDRRPWPCLLLHPLPCLPRLCLQPSTAQLALLQPLMAHHLAPTRAVIRRRWSSQFLQALMSPVEATTGTLLTPVLGQSVLISLVGKGRDLDLVQLALACGGTLGAGMLVTAAVVWFYRREKLFGAA